MVQVSLRPKSPAPTAVVLLGVALLGAALLGAASGCSRWKSSDPAGLFSGSDSSRRGGETQPIAGPGGATTGAAGLAVNVDGANITLSNGQVAATKSADFAPRLQTMLGERRRASAREFVQRQPDVAL
ncbi:MAG TPA: hypothetical protein PLV92_20400, partial [Pirellulaceae bacterium]|nr:hypothetical protein [Pirellulaceae bacterium]